MSIDLHVHSTFSDGTLTPAALVELAVARDLKAISITDHDTMEGTSEAVERGEQIGLEVVPGIELSVVHNDQHLHLLGYFVDSKNKELNMALHEIQAARIERNEKIIEKLCSHGLSLTIEDVQQKSKVGQMGRPHIAQVLVEKQYVRSLDEAFTRLLKRGAIAYVPRKIMDAAKAIRCIHTAGGLAVLAHPATIDNSLRKIPELVKQLVQHELDGIEVYYPVHSTKNRKQLSALASRYGLVVTGGSDYHGDIRPGTMLAGGKNVYVPVEVLQQMKNTLNH